jgi:sulfate transport system substrate-binding protein
LPSVSTLLRHGLCAVYVLLASLLHAGAGAAPPSDAVSLLNVSYDVSREFYRDYNAAFVAHWSALTGQTLTVNQSHGGSSRQARSVLDGLEADVVTMNQANDIDLLASPGQLLAVDWAQRFPDGSAPTTSVSVILVRKGNPRQIHDWADLGRPGISVLIPNPKTSGNGRYAYLAAWGAARRGGMAESAIPAAISHIIANVPVFDGGGRAATTTFAQRRIGDALVTFESEVPLILGEFGDQFEVIYPAWTVLAENPVAVVDAVARRHGTMLPAEAYLRYLWSAEGQEIAARHHLRPRAAAALARHASAFPVVHTFTVAEMFGGWKQAQHDHFDDGALYDQIVAAAGVKK